MKKLIAFFFLVFTFGAVFAQTSVPAPVSDNDIITVLVNFVTVKYPIVGVIGSVLFLLSEALANISSIKSNSVYEVISTWIKKLFEPKPVK